MYSLTNSLFFDILLLCYCTNLNSSIMCSLFYGDIYLSFDISLLASFFSKCNSVECNSLEDFFEAFVILSAVLLPIKSPVASAGFRIALFEAVFIASVVDFLELSISFWLCLDFYLYF